MAGLSRYRFASQLASSGVATTKLFDRTGQDAKTRRHDLGVLAYQQSGPTEAAQGGR